MIIELPNGQELEFPDGTSKEIMRSAISKRFPEYAQKKESPKGWNSVAEDVTKSITGLPNALYDFASKLPQQAGESAKQIVTNPLRATENIASGLLEGAKGAVNIPSNIAQYLKSRGIAEEGMPRALRDIAENQIRIGDTGLEKAVLGETQSGDELLRGLGSFAPYGAIGGLSKGLSGALKRAAGAGAYGIGQNQDPLQMALMGLAGEGVGKGLGKSVEMGANIRPSDFTPSGIAARLFRGELETPELKENVRAAAGTNTPLGRVLGEPKLGKTFESLTSQVPLSGGSDILNAIKTQVGERAENVVNSLKPEGVSGDLNIAMQDALKDAFEKQKDIKNELYKERNTIAEQEGHQLKLPEFEKLAKKTTKTIEESPLYKDDPKFRSQYNQLMGYKNVAEEIPAVESKVLNEYGKPFVLEEGRTIRPSLTEAQVTAGDLYERGKSVKKSPAPKDQILGNHLIDMSKALRKDIQSSVKEGSENLQKSHTQANKNFEENFSPFKDEEVFEKITQEEPQKIVREIIKPGKAADQYRDIEKVMALLPEDKKNILGYTYLKGAEDKYGKLNPKEVASLINALGNRQFKSLFPDPKIREALLDFGKLRGMNEEALNVLFNPKTGHKAIPFLQLGAAWANPKAAIGATAGSFLANKLLTSQNVRESIVKRILENEMRNSFKFSNPNILPRSLTASLMGMQGMQPKSGQQNE